MAVADRVSADGEFIRIDRSGLVVDLVLNRPHRRNALTGPLAVQLGDALEALADDASVSVIMLRGEGNAFCSGLDLTEFNADPSPPWLDDFGDEWRRVHRALFDSPKIIVGALERAAVNGGAALALACDFLVAGETAFLQVGEIQQGMPAPMNLSWLRLRHPEAVVARVALMGDRLTGPQLVSLGLAHEVVPDAEVLVATRALAEKLAGHDPGGVRRIKSALRATSFDGTAEEWFGRALGPDGLGSTRSRPIVAAE